MVPARRYDPRSRSGVGFTISEIAESKRLEVAETDGCRPDDGLPVDRQSCEASGIRQDRNGDRAQAHCVERSGGDEHRSDRIDPQGRAGT